MPSAAAASFNSSTSLLASATARPTARSAAISRSMPSSPGLPSLPPDLPFGLSGWRLVALPERGELLGEGGGGDRRRGVVEAGGRVQRLVLGRVQQLREELVPGRSVQASTSSGSGSKAAAWKSAAANSSIRGAEPLALGQQVAAPPSPHSSTTTASRWRAAPAFAGPLASADDPMPVPAFAAAAGLSRSSIVSRSSLVMTILRWCWGNCPAEVAGPGMVD